MPLENDSLDNQNEHENETKQTKAKQALSQTIIWIIVIATFVITKGCSKALVSGLFEHKKTVNNTVIEEQARDAAFIKGFEYINTSAVEEFCRDSGYIPYQFINEFKQTFPKTISNAQNIIDKISKQYNMDFNRHVLNSAAQSKVLETEFSSFQQHGFSKQDYCMVFDKERKNIISEKIKILQQQKPNMYLD